LSKDIEREKSECVTLARKLAVRQQAAPELSTELSLRFGQWGWKMLSSDKD
jgi:hypothetical protein